MNKNNYTPIYIFLMGSILFLYSCNKKVVQASPEQQFTEIKKVLYAQQAAWNNGDIEKFMEGYWKSEELSFVGKSGPTYSWASTLSNYQKGYPNREVMGTLKFDIHNIRSVAQNVCYMIGKYTLTRKNDMPSGHFTLLWEKKNGQWLITSDHTSG